MSDAWLNLNIKSEDLFNPLANIPSFLEEDPQLYIIWLMSQPEYLSFICRSILNIDIFPLQGVILKELWSHSFPMLIASRGAAKSYGLALYSLLRMLLMPGRKIVLCGAGFRQAKIVFEYMENIWNNAPILRDICRGNFQGPMHGTDMWTFRIGDSITKALPMGTGDKIRGQRANDIICVSKDTLVQTNQGLIEIKDYLDGNEYTVMNDKYDFESPSHIMITKPADVYQITTVGGYTLKCSEFHKIMTRDGWKKGMELTGDDYVSLDSNSYFPESYYKYEDIVLDENLAWTIGVMIAEGHIAKRNEIAITNTDYTLIQRIKDKTNWPWHEYYKPAYVDKRGFNCKESWTIKHTCTDFREKLYKMGLDYTIHRDKKIPKCILQSPQSVVVAFLAGLFEGDGTAFVNTEKYKLKTIIMAYYSTSYELCHHIQILLLKFGIYTALTKRKSNLSSKDQWMLRINGENGYNLYKLLDIAKWHIDVSKIKYREKKPSIIQRKDSNGTKYILSTWVGNKSVYIGTYKSQESCQIAFDEFWKTQRRAVRIKEVKKLSHQEVLYDFHIPQSHSFIGNGFVNHNCDEFDAINKEVFETVIVGFGAVSSTPVDSMKVEAQKDAVKRLGLKYTVLEKEGGVKANQTIIAGTAGYEFNHFCQYWRKWKAIIHSGGSEKELAQLFGGRVPKDLNWKDYCVIRVPIELIPRGFMDPSQIARSRVTLHSGIFDMEYSAVFSKDSTGFFKRTLIESCVASPNNNILKKNKTIVYYPLVEGEKGAKYVFGIDPASEVDKFSIVVLEQSKEYRKIVYCWTTDKKEHRERLRLGITSETTFHEFCTKKIRELVKLFPCDRIAIDSQGGGHNIVDCLGDTKRLQYGESPLLPIINPEKPADTDGMPGIHIIELVNFADAKWVAEANNTLRLDFESKNCLFPFKDSVNVAIAMGEKELSGNLYDTMEDNIFDIEELKNELSYIVQTKTASGRDKWDTPETKMPGTHKGRLRKDRYSALLMANMAARTMSNAKGPLDYSTSATWRFGTTKTKGSGGPDMIGPSWATNAFKDLYD